jgi:hypothetical protein
MPDQPRGPFQRVMSNQCSKLFQSLSGRSKENVGEISDFPEQFPEEISRIVPDRSKEFLEEISEPVSESRNYEMALP